MKRLQRFLVGLLSLALIVGFTFISEITPAQSQTISGASSAGSPGKPVTIPVTIRLKEKTQSESELQNIDLTIREDGDPQTLISIRAMVTNAPITLALLIQEDLVPSVSNEIKPLAEFLRKLPRGSRVMVGYLRAGSMQVRQKFTTDL